MRCAVVRGLKRSWVAFQGRARARVNALRKQGRVLFFLGAIQPVPPHQGTPRRPQRRRRDAPVSHC